jgi:hypothetical protein
MNERRGTQALAVGARLGPGDRDVRVLSISGGLRSGGTALAGFGGRPRVRAGTAIPTASGAVAA